MQFPKFRIILFVKMRGNGQNLLSYWWFAVFLGSWKIHSVSNNYSTNYHLHKGWFLWKQALNSKLSAYFKKKRKNLNYIKDHNYNCWWRPLIVRIKLMVCFCPYQNLANFVDKAHHVHTRNYYTWCYKFSIGWKTNDGFAFWRNHVDRLSKTPRFYCFHLIYDFPWCLQWIKRGRALWN